MWSLEINLGIHPPVGGAEHKYISLLLHSDHLQIAQCPLGCAVESELRLKKILVQENLVETFNVKAHSH